MIRLRTAIDMVPRLTLDRHASFEQSTGIDKRAVSGGGPG